MLKRSLLAAAALAALLVAPAAANDGFAGFTSTGLEFQKTDDIAMQSEDLYISPTDIRVDYVFKNTSSADVSGVVAFPMPPFAVSTFLFSPTQFSAKELDKENPLDFTATVDGQAVAVKADRRAYVPKPIPEPENPDAPYVPPPASAEYDDPGIDITEELTAAGIPLSYDPEVLFPILDKLPEDKLKPLIDKGYLGKDDANGPELRWIPGWAISTRYYWEQTFKAGAETKISHAYKAHPSGGLFYWYDWTKPDENWESDPNADDKAKYCITEAGIAEIHNALPQDPEQGNLRHGTAYTIQYVLTTANTWKGPIGTFKLTLDKKDEKSALAVCMDGIAKTGATTYTVDKQNWSPEKDLEVLVITAQPAFPE